MLPTFDGMNEDTSTVQKNTRARSRRKEKSVSPDRLAAAQLVALAKEQGVSLLGPEGLLKQLTKNIIEIALEEEMTEHLGYDKHDSPPGPQQEVSDHHRECTTEEDLDISPVNTHNTCNIRNGSRSKTVISETVGAR